MSVTASDPYRRMFCCTVCEGPPTQNSVPGRCQNGVFREQHKVRESSVHHVISKPPGICADIGGDSVVTSLQQIDFSLACSLSSHTHEKF